MKDRKGRKLFCDDIQHYQKIVVALNETVNKRPSAGRYRER